MTNEERLLIHETVSVTVDVILGAIQVELARAETAEGSNAKWREGFAAGLRAAETAASTASVVARSAAFADPIRGGDVEERLHDARLRVRDEAVL